MINRLKPSRRNLLHRRRRKPILKLGPVIMRARRNPKRPKGTHPIDVGANAQSPDKSRN
jgi:hypothetical protein